MSAEDSVEALPTTVAAISESIAGFQGQLVRHSILATSGQRTQPAWMLASSIQLNLRLYLTRSTEKTTFFFRKQRRTEVLLDTDLSVGLRPALRGISAPLPTPTYSMAGIPFVKEGFSAEELQRLASPQATSSNTVVFALARSGGSLLVLVNPRDKANRQVFFWTGGAKSTLEPTGKRWPLPPLLALLGAVQTWIADGVDSVPALPVTDLRVEEPSIQEIVESAKNAYIRLRSPLDPEIGPLSPILSDFHFRVTLRIDPRGRVADAQESDPFQIRFSIRKAPAGSPGELRFSVGPPDFLVSGELMEAFRNVLLGPKVTLLQNLWFRLRDSFPERDQLAAFVRSSFKEGHSLVFRVRREFKNLSDFPDLDEKLRQNLEANADRVDFEGGGKRIVLSVDTDILVLRGGDPGQDSILIFSAPFRVVPSLGPKGVDALITQAGQLKILYFGPTDGGLVDEEFAEYFFRLAANLKTWTKLL